jgi:hypothetical protein
MTCGACHQPATVRLRSGLLRCRPCWESLHIPGEPDVIQVAPIVPHEHPTMHRTEFVGVLAQDFKARQIGKDAA